MNNTWTEEQTQVSVKKQKKALCILLPFIAALVISLNILKDKFSENNIQQIIKDYCQSVDINSDELSIICNFESIDLEFTKDAYFFGCGSDEKCLS